MISAKMGRQYDSERDKVLFWLIWGKMAFLFQVLNAKFAHGREGMNTREPVRTCMAMRMGLRSRFTTRHRVRNQRSYFLPKVEVNGSKQANPLLAHHYFMGIMNLHSKFSGK